MKCKRNCPVCRTSKVFHNKQLEKHIKDQMVNCSNEGCPRMLFDWAIQEHLAMCPYNQYKCTFCDEFVSMQSLNKHIKSTCSVNWMEQTSNDHGGSALLAPYHTQSASGYFFDLKEIKQSFVVLYYSYVLIMERQDSRWLLTVLNHKKEIDSLQVKYSLPKTSNMFEIHSSLVINPSYSLHQVEHLPEIPIDAVDMQLQIINKDNDISDVAGALLARLFQPAVEQD